MVFAVSVTSAQAPRLSLDQLDAFARQVVEALCLLPAPATPEQLRSLFDPELPVPDLEAALDRLGSSVTRTGDRLQLTAAVRVDEPAGLGPPLATLLERQPASSLSALATRLGLPAPRAKKALLQGITKALSDGDRVGRLVGDGPAGAAELAHLAAGGPPRVFCHGGMYGLTDRTPQGWLLHRGLLVMTSWNVAVMPREVGLALRGGRPFPRVVSRRPPVTAVPAASVDPRAAEQALRLVHDVGTLLQECERAPVPLLKSGGVGVRELRRLARLVDRDEAGTARLLELAAAAGLLGMAQLTGPAAPLAGYGDWRDREVAARWAILVAGWLAWDAQLSAAGSLDDKDRLVPPLQVRDAERQARDRRRAVLAALGEVPGGGADVAALAARLSWDRPALWPASAPDTERLVGWVVAEAELLGLAAGGTLSAAGVAAGSGRLAEATALVAAAAPPLTDGILLQADLTALVAGEPSAALRAELDLLADVESRGSASVYRFSESSLRRGFDAGRTAQDVLDFLDAHTSRAVPQPLRYLVTDLDRRFGAARTGSVGGYLRSDDPALLAEILRSAAARRLELRQLAPTVAVSPYDGSRLVAELRAGGWLAATEGADGSLLVSAPAAERAVLAPELARMRERGAGRGRAFGPVDRVLEAVLTDRPEEEVARAEQPREPTDAERLRLLFSQSGEDEPERPTWMASGLASITMLLQSATQWEWCVLLDDGSGEDTVVVPLEVEGHVLYAQDPGAQEFVEIPLRQVQFARVLGEAEEEHWL